MTSSQKKILIAEDEELLRDIFLLVLEDEGYQVDVASNGAEAWELINNNHYDLVATDLYMPVMNGFDLIIKTLKDFPDIKTMLLSGGGKDIDAEEGQTTIKFKSQTIEVDLFLKKPYGIEHLLSSINKLLHS